MGTSDHSRACSTDPDDDAGFCTTEAAKRLREEEVAATLQETRDSDSLGLDLHELRRANVTRQAEWQLDVEVPLSYRGNEMGGECGEAQNVIKKLERERLGIKGSRDTVEHLASELGDVIICADLIAAATGIDLAAAVRKAFNDKSKEHSFKTFLEAKK